VAWPIFTGAAGESQQVNERYLDALASVDDSVRLQELLEPVEKRKQWQGRAVRALHPFSPEDGALLEAVSRGEFMLRGICNKDLQQALFCATRADSARGQTPLGADQPQVAFAPCSRNRKQNLRPQSLSGESGWPHPVERISDRSSG
jgi:hypothetical protein